ncbi:unnamed protein product [Blumeria hordei]|uniref:Uncharacterized protein n=2 Tax=Blumeria hordei TaxID=2867405 RepID=A0A383UQ72_BLUHO|nr:putative fungal protein [Blumeria hordei DH14]SZF01725.1 unnamed protein product [Blumeria hordei]
MTSPSQRVCLNSRYEDNSTVAVPFPAKSKQAVGVVDGLDTEVTSILFTDKILVTISQGGCLSQWVQVSLNSVSPNRYESGSILDSEDQLPLNHLSPKTLLGGGGEQRETVGHQYAIQVANRIVLRDPGETRPLLIGLGLEKIRIEREDFFDMMELIQQVI